MKFIAFGFLLLLAAPFAAHAQCAPGIPGAGNPGCIPPSAPNSPYNQGDGAPALPQAPPPVWQDRWGAIAFDEATSSAGVSTNQTSQRHAESMALSNCEKAGGKHCQVNVTYHNQCVAVAQKPGGGRIGVSRGPSIKKASDVALKNCGSDSCKVAYSNCTDAVRVQ
ncbi:hypothetical protein CAL12_06630 [Bordetella genomosp. 8]|uniref:DUF4189 domain-containing protein n=1 Tax=Bordetella genomosp. 8 TaxID=1416806 RepID=A0A1W6YHM3_9BORD|nr:DUF4189 domain-containing protein [Bordetella genomosp. 8]ARP80541.1 hypothetical protein CAL12_06630 [Bordetella genomosp. 8]